jgi:hypothetical protein
MPHLMLIEGDTTFGEQVTPQQTRASGSGRRNGSASLAEMLIIQHCPFRRK